MGLVGPKPNFQCHPREQGEGNSANGTEIKGIRLGEVGKERERERVKKCIAMPQLFKIQI